jgi:hypothetical protein
MSTLKKLLERLLEPVLNQRGQYYPLGVAPPPAMAGVTKTGTAEEQREYAPFLTSEPGAQFADLMQRYQSLLGGGAGSFGALIDLQRSKGLEALANTGRAMGRGRSPVQQAAAAQFLEGFEPRAAAMQSEYLMNLLSNYAGAVEQGRRTFTPIQTTAKRTEQDQTTGAAVTGGSEFQYIPRNPFSGSDLTGGGGGGGGGSVSGGSRGGTTGGFSSGSPTGGTVEQFLTGQYGGATSVGPEGGYPSFSSLNPYTGITGGITAQSGGTNPYQQDPARKGTYWKNRQAIPIY